MSEMKIPRINLRPEISQAEPTFSRVLQSVEYTRTVVKPFSLMSAISTRTSPADLQAPVSLLYGV